MVLKGRFIQTYKPYRPKYALFLYLIKNSYLQLPSSNREIAFVVAHKGATHTHSLVFGTKIHP